MSEKVTFKKQMSHRGHAYDVTFKQLTPGEILAMKNALEMYSKVSAVGSDVRDYLNNGLEVSEDSTLKAI